MAQRKAAPRATTMPRHSLVHLLAVGGGLGYTPVAPGTAGSLLGVLVGLLLLQLAWPLHLAAVLLFTALAVVVCVAVSGQLEDPDPPRVVIDEVAGMLLATLALPPTLYDLTAAFLLFRLFDIVKPAPLPRLERLPRGLGIIADDLAAGLLARAAWWLLQANFDFL